MPSSERRGIRVRGYMGGLSGAAKVANSNGSDAPAHQRAGPDEGSRPHIGPISGAECAMALHRAGLRARVEGPDHVWFESGGIPIVCVPLVERLHPALMRTILNTLGMTPLEFLDLLRE